MKRLLLYLLTSSLFPLMADQSALDQIQYDHGLSLAISGMLIVFSGLAAIAGFMSYLPKLLKQFESRRKSEAVAPVKTVPVSQAKAKAAELDEATLAAIAFVLQAESDRAAGRNLKVTLPLQPSPWALSSNMRIIPGRISS